MDINKHLKMLNLTSIKRDRKKSPQVSTVVEYDIPEEMPEDMIKQLQYHIHEWNGLLKNFFI